MKVKQVSACAMAALALVATGCSSAGTNNVSTDSAAKPTPAGSSTASSTGTEPAQKPSATTSPSQRSPRASEPTVADSSGKQRKPSATTSTSNPNSDAKKSTVPEPTTKPTNQIEVLNSLPGNPTTECVSVGSNRDMRSGSIAAGNFAEARANYTKTSGNTEQPSVFLYVIPQHSKKLQKVTVTVDPITASGKRRTVESTSVEKAEMWRYFGVNVPISSPGKYRLTMVSGSDRGCFDVSFAK